MPARSVSSRPIRASTSARFAATSRTTSARPRGVVWTEPPGRLATTANIRNTANRNKATGETNLARSPAT